jgi:hypothetical protein
LAYLPLSQLEPLKGLNDLRLALVEATEKIQLVSEENKQLTAKIVQKNKKNSALEAKVNSLEQYGRRDCVEIHGIEKANKENYAGLILGLVVLHWTPMIYQLLIESPTKRAREKK